jgi:alkylglycerol monooxygenase
MLSIIKISLLTVDTLGFYAKERLFPAREILLSFAAGAISLYCAPVKLMLIQTFSINGFMKIEPSLYSWLALILLWDFFSYFFHRAAHSVRFIWSRHYQHHTFSKMCVINGLRNQVLGFTWEIPLWASLIALGFPFLMVLQVTVWSKFYILMSHTVLCPRLPFWIEYVFVTPYLHHIHHQRDSLGKNFGSVFIVWDRLFGTFSSKSTGGNYGTDHSTPKNLLEVYFKEDVKIYSDLRQSKTWKERWKYLTKIPRPPKAQV